MIKIFGWEKNVADQINQARESELAALLQLKVSFTLNLVDNTTQRLTWPCAPDFDVMESHDEVRHLSIHTNPTAKGLLL